MKTIDEVLINNDGVKIMFGSRKALEKETFNRIKYQEAFFDLRDRWDSLIDRLNKKGGEEFINNATLGTNNSFTDSDIKLLLRFCHPDKNNNSKDSNKITRKLLELRQGK